ncbi:MAG: cysteine hydrolase family protein [Thermomicrobiaceae bacterium]
MEIPIPSSAALLVIDVQQGMHDPSMGNRNNPDAEANLERLLDAWREQGRPVINVNHNSIHPTSVFHASHPGNQIQEFARPKVGEPLFEKSANCAFIGTDLETYLRDRGIDTVVIVGFVTNHCVETTARIAGDLGFDTYVVSDATAAFDRVGPDGTHFDAETIHSVALTSIHGEFATVVDTQAVLASIAPAVSA